MPAWPRNPGALPRLATPAQFPSGLRVWSESGKGQARAVQNMGRGWQEIYPLLDGNRQSVRQLMAAINQALREGTIFTIQHPYWHSRFGVGGGSPKIKATIDQAWRVDASAGPAFVDETTDANSGAANDWQLFPAGASVDDYAAVGFVTTYGAVQMNIGTAGVGTYTVTWEYWNGSSWSALGGVVDGTNAFKTVGLNTVTFTVPTNWAASVLNSGASLYYVRARRDGGTVTTDPLATQGFVRWPYFGSNLYVVGATPSITNWLRYGDIISVQTAPVMIDVVGDVNTDGAGNAIVPISPPLFPGVNLTADAPIELNPGSIFMNAMVVGVSDFPELDSTRYLSPGLTVTWREQPT